MTVRTPLPEHAFFDLATMIEPLTPAFELLDDHVVITDPAGNIIYANPAVERNTGYSPSEAIGKNPGDLWGGEMPKTFYEEMWDTIHNEKKPWTGEVQNRRKDGTLYWQELRITPVLNDKQEIAFFVGIEPNITTRKTQEERAERRRLFYILYGGIALIWLTDILHIIIQRLWTR